MKKLIAIGSVGLGLVLGAALAHADDSNTSTTSSDTSSMSNTDQSAQQQQAGTSADTNAANTANAPTTGQESTTTKSTTVAKTCTDEAGTTYEYGKKGYKHCMKMKKKKEMGGSMGSDTSSMNPSSSSGENQ